MKRKDNETYVAYCKRVTNAYSDGVIELNEWAYDIFGEEASMYSAEYQRRAYIFFKQFVAKLDKEDLVGISDDDKLNELKDTLEAIKAEKIKVNTLNIEYNANARAEARSELFNEQIVNAIDRLKPIEFKQSYIRDYPHECEGVLCIADAHNGVEIDMKSLFGEVVNVYNPDILKARLNRLLNEMVSDKAKYMDYTKLTVFDLGDSIQGILRMSDLAKLKLGVLDSALDYAEFISQWLVRLSDELEIPIDYICLGGNHCELRLIGGKKGDFPNENIGKVIQQFIKLRLDNNPNINVAPYAECGFKSIQGVNILAYHGDDAKNDEQEIAFWEQYHQVDIDILIEAHIHHKEEASVGYALNGGDKEVIHIPSLVGADVYGKKLRKIARAGAKFMMFEDGAKTWERTYVLN